MQLPDSAFGQRVHCPACQQVLLVTTAPAAGAGATPCPACNTLVDASATACPDCGFLLNADAAAPEAPPNLCANPNCGVANAPGVRVCARCNEPLPMPSGTLLHGRYRIDKLLKTGGFGAVYRGVDTWDADRQVAIKDMITGDPKEFALRLKFFQREAEILRALERVRSVPRLYDFHHEGQAALLVMEFIHGENLLEIMRQLGDRPFPLDDVIEWGKAICDVLQVMHSQSPALIYRDLKPDNIMLLEDRRTIKMIDFGAARDLGRTAKERALKKTGIYTEGYAPIEQVAGKPDERSDLFALAATLYHLATGKEPAGSTTGVEIYKQLADPKGPIPPQHHWFYELIRINLSDDLRDRYPSAHEFRADLIAQRVTFTRPANHPAAPVSAVAKETDSKNQANGDTDELDVVHPNRADPKTLNEDEFDVSRVTLSSLAATDEPVLVLEPEPDPATDPLADLRAVCRTSPPNWADIFFLASDAKNSGHEIAPELLALTREAEARSVCVQRLLVALNEGKLQAIVDAYDPVYLDDWPVYADEVAKAKNARAALKTLHELEALALTTRTGRTLLKRWAEYEPELAKWPESEPIRKKVSSWKARLRAVESVRRLVEQKVPRERSIVEAWDKLEALGGHPEAAPLHGRVKIAAARAECLERLPPVSAPESEDTDALVLQAWDQIVLAECPEAQQHRDRYDQARQRLQAVAALATAIAQADQGVGAEEAILDAAQHLKSTYKHPHKDRVSLAQSRVRLADAVKKALRAKPASDKAIAAAWEKASKAGCRFDDETIARGRLAVQRRQCLLRLEGIKQTAPLDQRDQQLLSLWDDDLLGGCADAEALRQAHATAVERVAAWKALEQALAENDRDRIVALVGQPLLADYPPYLERQAELQDLAKQAQALRQLKELLERGDGRSLVEGLDFGYLRAHQELYLPQRCAIEAMLTRWLQETKLTSKSDPAPRQDPFTGLVQVRWTWPYFGAISHCRVAVSAERCFETIAQAKGQTMHWDADDHRRVGGGMEVPAFAESRRMFVTVWPALDLGWTELIGPPLHIGPIRTQPPPTS
jgi:serine/threonine protein kinase